jgi:5,10-methylenetetrahydromethanopterin reductase
MGYRRATVNELRQAVELIRRLRTGEFVEYNSCRIRMQAGATARRFPIYQSATGPRMLELAGEVADGAILLLGVSPECLNWAREHLEIGGRRAGRRLDGFEVVCGTFCYPSDTYSDAVDHIRPIAATFMIDHGPVLAQAGIKIPPNIDMEGLYPDVIHAEDWDRAIEKTRKWMPYYLAVEFAEKFCLLGTPRQIAEKLLRISAHGFCRNFYVRGVSTYRYPTEVAKAFREVIPMVQGSART